MAKVVLLNSQRWIVWLLCWLLLLSAVLSDTDPDRRHRKKKKTNGGRERLVYKTRHNSGHMNKNYKDRVSKLLVREQTTSLPEFLPDGPRPDMPDPTFMPGEEFIEVHQGDVATLPCTVQNLGARQISWKKTGNEHFLSIGTDIWVQDANLKIQHYAWPAEVSNWNLEFRSARLEDSGVYQCQIISTEKMTWSVELSVIEKPPHNPEISIEGKEFVESGQSVYLRCNTTEGDRIPDDVDWFKDGDKIESSAFPNILITKFRSKETMTLISELMIVSGHSKDSGTYICRSSSSLIASIEVNVLVGKKADSANVKRGTGTSSTRTQTVNDQNVGSSIMYRYFPFFLGHPLIFLVLIVVHYVT